MMRKTLLGVVYAMALALAVPGPARATGPFTLTQRNCFDRIATFTTKVVDAVHDEIRVSIKKNLQGVSSLCGAATLACAGGPNKNKACTSNAFCGTAGGIAFQCQTKATAGIAGAIGTAKTNLRNQIASACTQADLNALYGLSGNARCPDPSMPANGLSPAELADCIVRTAAGQIDARKQRGTVGEILGSGAPDFAVDTPILTKACGVVLGAITHVGSLASSAATVTTTGSTDPLLADGCSIGNPLCPTKGELAVGNLVAPPQQTFAGTIPICMTTRSLDAGNGTPESGRINLSTGLQDSYEPVAFSINIGVTCPICNKATLSCDTGAHAGLPCTSPGETDVACPPQTLPSVPIIAEELHMSTEATVLAVPPNNPAGGTSNPAGAFCGACDLDEAVSCTNDSDCVSKAICSGAAGSGCCRFGSNIGAFGDANAQAVQVEGTRSPFLPQLASLGCAGKTGDGIVDNSIGLPGPLRSVQTRLNAFQY